MSDATDTLRRLRAASEAAPVGTTVIATPRDQWFTLLDIAEAAQAFAALHNQFFEWPDQAAAHTRLLAALARLEGGGDE